MRWRLVAVSCSTALGCAQLLAVDELAPVDASSSVAAGAGGGAVNPECAGSDDCPTPEGVCRVSSCEQGICVEKRSAVGTACGADASCNAEGACLLARGSSCEDDGTCASGHCVDGVCCESECGACSRCALPGLEGGCEPLDSGAFDATGACGKARCDGLGHCATGAAEGVVISLLAPGMDRIAGAARRSDGGWFVGGGHTTTALPFLGGVHDGWLATVTATGKVTNALSFGSPFEDGILAVAVDSKDNGYAVGVCGQGTSFPVMPALACNGAQRNSLLMKVNSAGSLAWAKVLDDSPEPDSTDDVVVTSKDEVIVVGSGGPSTTTAGVRRARMTKFDPDGAVLWNREFSSTSNFVTLRSMVLMPDGDILAPGTFRGTLGILSASVTSVAGSDDIFVVRFDPTVQTVRWLRGIGGAYADQVYRLAVAPDGTVGLVGLLSYSTNIDKNLVVTGDAIDSFAALLDGQTGAVRWGAPIVGTADIYAVAVTFDAASNLVVGGSFYTPPNGTPGTLSLFGRDFLNAGLHDAFVAKVSPTGIGLWQRAFGGVGSDLVLALLHEQGGVLATGSTSGGYAFGAFDVKTADGQEDGALFLFAP
jgi:hypothetical protein